MLRIESKALEKINALLYYKKTLFTGYSYEFHDNLEYRRTLEIEKGKVKGEYLGGYLQEQTEVQRFHFDALVNLLETGYDNEDKEEDEEYDCYDEEADIPAYSLKNDRTSYYTGITYIFNEDDCLLEEIKLSSEGQRARSIGIHYLPSGQMIRFQDAICNITEWFECGNISLQKLCNPHKKDERFTIRYNINKLIYVIYFDKNFKYDLKNLNSYKLSGKVDFFGEGVTDDSFEYFVKTKDFSQVEDLAIKSTCITGHWLFSILHDGMRLTLSRNEQLDEATVEEIKKQFPNIDLSFTPIDE